MSASDWAAWVGAVSGVVALGWEVVKWTREGPRLRLRTSPSIRVVPDQDGRLILAVWVTNTGTAMTTLTTFALIVFKSRWRRWRTKPGQNWVVLENPVGQTLPFELRPGQQWMGGVRLEPKIATAVASGKLYAAIYHSLGKRPVTTLVRPAPEREGDPN